MLLVIMRDCEGDCVCELSTSRQTTRVRTVYAEDVESEAEEACASEVEVR